MTFHKYGIVLALLFLVGSAAGADLITATVTFTNNPAGNGSNFVINGSTRTWTNDVSSSPGTLVGTTNTSAMAATNLLNHLTSFPQSTGHYLYQTGPTNVLIRGRVGEALTVTIGGNWGRVSYGTQSVSTPTIYVRVPYTVEAATNQTNVANGLVDYIEVASEVWATNTAALGNFLSKGITFGGGTQEVVGPVRFRNFQGTNTGFITGGTQRNGTFTNGQVFGTNGLLSDVVLLRPTLTNGANYGTPFRSPGGGTGSEQFGLNATASTNSATAIGNNASAAGVGSTSLGYNAAAGMENSIALGAEVELIDFATNGVGIGFATTVSARNGVALGWGAAVASSFTDSVSIGRGVEATDTNQVKLGRDDGSAYVPGRFLAGSHTNVTATGTNTVRGDLSFDAAVNSSVANGANAGVLLGTNVYIRIMGPSASYTLAGFAAERAGAYHILQLTNPAGTITIPNESGLEATAANRILTSTGADLSLTNNPSFLQLIRDGAATRWRVMMHSR